MKRMKCGKKGAQKLISEGAKKFFIDWLEKYLIDWLDKHFEEVGWKSLEKEFRNAFRISGTGIMCEKVK